jgi:hypothetical protein
MSRNYIHRIAIYDMMVADNLVWQNRRNLAWAIRLKDTTSSGLTPNLIQSSLFIQPGPQAPLFHLSCFLSHQGESP